MRTSMGMRVRRLAVAAILVGSVAAAQAPQTATALTNTEFWTLVTDLSEPGGAFAAQLMSNEDSAQFVVPSLAARVRPGGIYLGVGSEQNFTYLATLRPRLAFIIDIRRDNLLEMLMYKALFEVSSNRADFVARLFARPQPDGLPRAAAAPDLFAAFERVKTDTGLLDSNTRTVLDRLTRVRALPLSDADRATIAGMLAAFSTAGPGGLKGFGDRTNPTYAELMAATDRDGTAQSFLASEERFAAVRDLQLRNLVVPVTGDFAGDTALRGIGRYLTERGATVDVFYVSNVERYLFERPDKGAPFYANVSALPRTDSSVFIRSITRDISQRLGVPLPSQDYKWWTFLFPIGENLAAIATGQVGEYKDLFKDAR